MKALPVLFCAVVAILALTSCESDLPPEPDEVANKFERGITGQGTLYQPDRSDDPYVRETDRVGN